MLRSAITLLALCTIFAASRPVDIPFEKVALDLGANEAAAIVDLNRDGKLDIVSGENWYPGPDFKKLKFRDLPFTNNYIDNFSDLAADYDGDGYIDLVHVSWFSKTIAFWKNPGRTRIAWHAEPLQEGFNVEFAFLVDIDNDGKAMEILPQFGNREAPLSWYEFAGGKWRRHEVNTQSYGHGIGAGDLNGDGRTDILTPRGWFEAPADPRAGKWTFHADWEDKKPEALGFMHVADIDGDGRNDIVTSMAHDYGIFWLQNDGEGKWTKRVIDDAWSQGHALTFVDLNGDGKKDILTGKRFMAHNGRDPGEKEPLGIYWYEYRTMAGGKGVEWVRHVVDYSTRTGGGMQLPVADIDGDGDLDFVAPGKSGLFLFVNKTK